MKQTIDTTTQSPIGSDSTACQYTCMLDANNLTGFHWVINGIKSYFSDIDLYN